MDTVKDVLFLIDANRDYLFLAFGIIFYYLSIKKCFRKDGKSRIGLFCLTLTAFPFTVYFVTVMAVTLPLEMIRTSGLVSKMGFVLITMPVSTVLYIVLIFLFSDLIAKWK